VNKLFENWNRYLNEADDSKWKRQPRGGGRGYGDRYASDNLTKFEDRLRSLGIDDARHLVQFLIGLAGMGDDPAEWAEGERQQTLDDITAVLARESDPQQTPVSDEELSQMRLSRELVLLRIDNKKALSIMRSIRDLLTLSDKEQEEIINELMHFAKLSQSDEELYRELIQKIGASEDFDQLLYVRNRLGIDGEQVMMDLGEAAHGREQEEEY